MSVRALIVTGFGINCNRETDFAFEQAEAETIQMHVNDLAGQPALLERFHILAIPGGFSYGDDVASGKILANRLRYQLGDALQAFVAEEKLVIGICNGFQVLVKLGLLPGNAPGFHQEVTLTHNDSSRFEDRWVHLKKDPATPCIWLEGLDTFECPIRHGEGKFIPRDDAMLRSLQEKGQIALRYSDVHGQSIAGAYPANPNGSVDDIAGICDPSGRVFGLMPHPEAFLRRTNHPRWTRETIEEPTAGALLFENAVRYAQHNLL